MKEPLPIGMKLKLERKRLNLTQKELGERLGVGQSTVSDLEGGGLQSWHIHRDALARIFGKPKSFFEPGTDEVSESPPEIDAAGDMPDSVAIPEYDVRLSAGGGFEVDQESTRRYWPLPRFLVVERLNVSPNQATVQEVIGDSMEPTLSSGDYVLIDLSDTRIGLPGIFAIWDGDALVCKRVERIPASEPSEVRLKSDNPLHGEYRVPEERVRVIGRVRWVTRRM
ncbi:S24 family peptidase [Phenylobacterium sp.]|uniref:S24 family peptidase n=1 Tax=Phenylobacterium sp. TaxID=1871053 RepID=UPI0030011A92